MATGCSCALRVRTLLYRRNWTLEIVDDTRTSTRLTFCGGKGRSIWAGFEAYCMAPGKAIQNVFVQYVSVVRTFGSTFGVD